ncbi:MAG: PHP-associated domain-containing protein, partial [Thermoplasmata archaeon]
VSRVAARALLVIPGAEMKTNKGDLLALFVEEEVKTRDWADAVDQIRSRGGLSIVPHPFDSPRLTKEDIVLADGLEVFNSTCSARSNSLSSKLAMELKKPGFATSDAHRVSEIGNGRTSVPDCSSLDSLRESILVNPVVSRTIRSSHLLHRMNSLMVFGIKGMWRR